MNAIQQSKKAETAGEAGDRTAAPVPAIERSGISGQIWDMKYRLKVPGGAAIDSEIEDTWKRVAGAIARAEPDPGAWEDEFYRALEDYKFLPAGRILAGAGAERAVTLFNCFVMGEIPDDMGGIFAHLREAALTMQQGGGIGYDFSTLRPKGAPVKRVGADASGPLSFMDVWDSMCRTIMSAGSRRGAMMATMRCDHPDIEAFIEAKREKGRLRMFNLSVLVTDAFMQAVETGADWDLRFDGVVYRTVAAAELWDRIMEATYAYAEPGVIFIDRINRRNNLHYCETIHATNPCVTGDTRVLTEQGEKRIDEMLDGTHLIMGSDGAWHPIEAAFKTGTKEVLELVAEDGGGRRWQLKLTPGHRVLTPAGDRRAQDLEPGDAVVCWDAGGGRQADAQVMAIESAGEADVYDLTEPETHHFVANGIVVHNCGEQPLPPYGACLLGSINLARLVEQPFTEAAALDLEELDRLVAMAVRMMDNVIDISRFALEEQRKEAEAKRRIGLGITGLADALIMCGVRYGSEDAVALTERWMAALQRRAYLASVELAKEKGPFPLYDRDAYLAGETIRELDADVQEAISRHGIRNALLTSVAPTGTISLFADNVSSGLEPVFSFSYNRQVLMPDGSKRQEEVSDYAYRLYRRMFGEEAELPAAFVDAQQLTPDDHLVMQAAVQRHVDSSISKTINVPEDIAFDAFKDVYRRAYDLGCKGCTTYRPNDITGAVLEVAKEAGTDETDGPTEAAEVASLTEPLTRPFKLPGYTYKLKVPHIEAAFYVTINDTTIGGRSIPFEIFINSKDISSFEWVVALTRMISAVFRRGGDVSFLVDELKAVSAAGMGGAMWARMEWDDKARVYNSFVAVLGACIEQHMRDSGYLPAGHQRIAELPAGGEVTPLAHAAAAPKDASALAVSGGAIRGAETCPKCRQRSFVAQAGCKTCLGCGHSNCG